MLSWPTLTGNWQLERQTSHGMRATGTVSILGSGEQLHYHEDVMTSLQDGTVLAGERRYNLRYTGPQLKMYYADGPDIGKLFQTFNLQSGEAQSTHICGEDTYHSTFKWHANGSFSLTHDVQGPAKNYIMHTVYTKAL